jgi:hypothetical protein
MSATKDQLKSYLTTPGVEKRHAFEKQHLSDELVMDAIEGYSEHPDAWPYFEKINARKKMKRRLYRSMTFLFIFVAIGLAGWLSISTSTKQKESNLRTAKYQKVMKQPIRINIFDKEEVALMKPIAAQHQIKSSKIALDFIQQQEQASVKEGPIEPIQQIPLEAIHTSATQTRLAKKIGRELLIKNYKLIDYRYYRKSNFNSRPIVDASNQEEEIHIPYINMISSAIEHFSAGEFKLCLLETEQILSAYPNDANALFYSSLSLFNLNELKASESRLIKLRAAEFSNFDEEAEWYLLMVYKQVKNQEKFIELKKEIIEANGFYAQRAKNLNF